MSTIIIGADAAKLAGLQIDTLRKVRSGQITLESWEMFNNLSPEERLARFSDEKRKPAEPVVKKFALLADLGTITVPKDYDHATQLETFLEKNRKKFYDVNENITDAHFPNPTRILKPGDKLRVRAFKQIVEGTTTSEERMAFLATQKAVHTGAQGASLVFEQKRDKLPKGYWYASFDEKERLWEDALRCHRVPSVDARSSGVFFWRLGDFEKAWDGRNAFLCLCDSPA